MKEIKTSNTVQAAWVALSSFSAILISIGSAAILSRYLSKSDLGTYKQVLYIYNTLLVVFTAGLPRVYSYFLPRFPRNEGYSIIQKVNKILFLSGIFLGLVLYFGSGFIANLLVNPGLESNLKLFAVVPPLLMQTLGIEGVLVSYQMSKFLPIYNVLTRLMTLAAITLPIVLIGSNVRYAMYGWIIASIISFFIAFNFFRIPFKDLERQNSILTIKTILNYSLPIVGASLAGIAIGSADQFYISRYFGVEVFAEFSNGFIQLPFIGMIIGSASTVIMPRLSQMFGEKVIDAPAILTLFKSVIKKSATLIYLITSGVILNAKEIMVLIYGEGYIESAYYFQLKSSLGYFSIILFTPFLLASGNALYFSRVQVIGAVLIWSFYYPVILIFNSPLIAAALSVAVFIVLVFIGLMKIKDILNVKISEILPFGFLALVFGQTLLCSFLSKGATYLFDFSSDFVTLIVFGMFYLSLIFASSKLLKVNYLAPLEPLLQKIKKR